MHPDTMRFIDRWAGIPLCFFTSLLLWKKNKTVASKKVADTIVFIGIAEIGALVEFRKPVNKIRIVVYVS